MKDTYVFSIILVVLALLIYMYSWKISLMFNSGGISLYTPDSFPIRDGKENDVKKIFVQGLRYAKSSSIIISGMLRDASKSVPTIIRKVEMLGEKFGKYKVLIVENDSKDNTRALLLDWASRNPRVTILGCGINTSECKMGTQPTIGHGVNRRRIQKMVTLRNIILDHIRGSSDSDDDQTDPLSSYAYTAIWDLDTIGSVYIDGVMNTIYHLEQSSNAGVDAVCANGIYRWVGSIPIYYDTYAHLDHGDKFHISTKYLHDVKKGLTQGTRQRGDDLVDVKSCFSGFTIYRTSGLLAPGVEYDMSPENGSDDNLECEHVRLHAKLKGSVRLNPSMVNLVVLNE
jgi:hypothetical protein